MLLRQLAVNCVNRCRALLSRVSHFETLLFLSVFILLPTGRVQASENIVVVNSGAQKKITFSAENEQATAAKNTSDQLVQSLKKDAISIRRDGQTIRLRFLRGGNDLAPAIRDLQSVPHNLFQKNFNSALGPGSSGGGFSHYYGSYAKTIEDVQSMINQFNRMPGNLLKDYLPPKYWNSITPQKIVEALAKTKISFFQEGLTVAPNGMVDILEADYVNQDEGSYIILLKSFFEKYNSIAKDDQLSLLRSRVILHEITHLFGVGTVEDKESWDLSFYLLLALSSEERFCVNVKDCENPAATLRRQYNNREYQVDRLEKIKKEIETDLHLSELKLNASIRHGLISDFTSGYTLWKISGSEAIRILVPADLKSILPDEFRDISQNKFAAQLLASLSFQKSVAYAHYVAAIEAKKSRWSSYEVSIFESKDGILYSKSMSEQLFNISDEEKETALNFIKDRGDCYGEKIERPEYKWTYLPQHKLCLGSR